MRSNKMPVPDLVVILRRMGDEMDAGLAGRRSSKQQPPV
jgi:hypothetical protein